MIERLQRIATRLTGFRWLLMVIAAFALAVLLVSLLEYSRFASEDLIIPSILSFIWAVGLYSFAGVFVRIPGAPPAGAGWRARLSHRIRRGAIWVLGLLMLALGGSLLMLTFQLLRAGSVG